MPSGRLSKKDPDAGDAADASGGVGPRWGCLSQDRPTRFVVAWAFARSEAEVVPEIVRQTCHRTYQHAGLAWVSDGRVVYRREICRTYRDPQRTDPRGRSPLVPMPGGELTQVVKHRRHGRVVGVEVRPVLGESVPFPYLVHEERLNGVLRDWLNALTRRTHAFAKDTRPWDALVTVCLFEHNGLRPHPALREPAESLANGRRYRRRTTGHGYRLDRSCLELGRIPDLQTLLLPKEVTTQRDPPGRITDQ